MSTEEIKLKIFRQVDSLDANKLKELYGVIQNYFNSKREEDEWIGVNMTEKQGIEDAMHELDAGKGIPDEQVMSRLRKKYTNA